MSVSSAHVSLCGYSGYNNGSLVLVSEPIATTRDTRDKEPNTYASATISRPTPDTSVQIPPTNVPGQFLILRCAFSYGQIWWVRKTIRVPTEIYSKLRRNLLTCRLLTQRPAFGLRNQSLTFEPGALRLSFRLWACIQNLHHWSEIGPLVLNLVIWR